MRLAIHNIMHNIIIGLLEEAEPPNNGHIVDDMFCPL